MALSPIPFNLKNWGGQPSDLESFKSFPQNINLVQELLNEPLNFKSKKSKPVGRIKHKRRCGYAFDDAYVWRNFQN